MKKFHQNIPVKYASYAVMAKYVRDIVDSKFTVSSETLPGNKKLKDE